MGCAGWGKCTFRAKLLYYQTTESCTLHIFGPISINSGCMTHKCILLGKTVLPLCNCATCFVFAGLFFIFKVFKVLRFFGFLKQKVQDTVLLCPACGENNCPKIHFNAQQITLQSERIPRRTNFSTFQRKVDNPGEPPKGKKCKKMQTTCDLFVFKFFPFFFCILRCIL